VSSFGGEAFHEHDCSSRVGIQRPETQRQIVLVDSKWSTGSATIMQQTTYSARPEAVLGSNAKLGKITTSKRKAAYCPQC
jgi:hypothetical protein